MLNQKAATQFSHLLAIADRLLGDDGCPWDKKQTYETLRCSLLEECYEVLDALDANDIPNLAEELGDLLYNLIFISKIGEKRGEFSLHEVCELICDKLISRHPHIFAEAEAKSAEEVIELWEAVKQKEKRREHPLDGIPKALPALAKASAFAKKMRKEQPPTFESAEELGVLFWDLVCQARTLKIDPESALRAHLQREEQCYRSSKRKS